MNVKLALLLEVLKKDRNTETLMLSFSMTIIILGTLVFPNYLAIFTENNSPVCCWGVNSWSAQGVEMRHELIGKLWFTLYFKRINLSLNFFTLFSLLPSVLSKFHLTYRLVYILYRFCILSDLILFVLLSTVHLLQGSLLPCSFVIMAL